MSPECPRRGGPLIHFKWEDGRIRHSPQGSCPASGEESAFNRAPANCVTCESDSVDGSLGGSRGRIWPKEEIAKGLR